MNLIIDQGNTRTKLAIFNNGKIYRTGIINSPQVADVIAWVGKHAIARGLVSSVVNDRLFEGLAQAGLFPVYHLHQEVKLPFVMKYATPQTLGLDRVALAAAAATQYPGQDCLVVDAGTCITYDFVNRAGEYLGGAISPGLHMRFKALHQFTAKLPLGSPQNFKDFIGRSTDESLASGVINGTVCEVQGAINQYKDRFPKMITVLTGGDASIFDGFTKNGIFAAPEFLLQGLNNILEYHAEML